MSLPSSHCKSLATITITITIIIVITIITTILSRRGSFDENENSPGRTSNQSFLNLHSSMQFSHLKKVLMMMMTMMVMIVMMMMVVKAIITFSHLQLHMQ